MVASHIHTYGLGLTENSKVGWAFSLSRRQTCIQSTDVCRRVCYGNGIRYQTDAQRNKRERNFRTIELLLSKGGPELLAENLVALIDQARPIDWFAARANGVRSTVPWVLRIHDVGDFPNEVNYVSAWQLAAKNRPQCGLWFYTRSFQEPVLLSALSEFASLPNCQGFLSIDNENFEQGLRAFAEYPGIWKLALLQLAEEELSPELLPALRRSVDAGSIINFPYHRAGKHVAPLKDDLLISCPQVTTAAFPLQPSRMELKPCQACRLCLPG